MVEAARGRGKLSRWWMLLSLPAGLCQSFVQLVAVEGWFAPHQLDSAGTQPARFYDLGAHATLVALLLTGVMHLGYFMMALGFRPRGSCAAILAISLAFGLLYGVSDMMIVVNGYVSWIDPPYRNTFQLIIGLGFVSIFSSPFMIHFCFVVMFLSLAVKRLVRPE